MGKYDDGLKYGKSALELAKRLQFKNGMAFSYHIIGINYHNKGDFENALENYDKSLKIKEELGDKRGMAISYNNIGIVHANKGDYDKALEFYMRALSIREEIGVEHPNDVGNKKGMATSYNNIGLFHADKGNYEKALEFYFKSLKIMEELGDKNGMANSYNNIGLIHSNKGDYEKALEFYLKDLKITEELGGKNGMASTYNNIGIIYMNKDDYEKALEFYLKALKITEESGDKNAIAYTYNNIGVIHANKGDYEKALEFYLNSLKIREEIGEKKGIADSYINIGLLYSKEVQIERPLNKFPEARIYLNKGLQLSIEIGIKDFLKDVYEGLSDLDSMLGNYKSAYIYHQLHALYKDSLFNEETTKQIADMQTRYEADKKEKENSILRKNKEIRILEGKQKEEQERLFQEKIERRNRLQYSAIVLGLFVLFLGIFLFAKRYGKFTDGRDTPWRVSTINASLFIAFLIFFEFITVLIDPFIEKFTGGEPMFKLLLNAVLATIIFPIHHYLEKKLSGAFIPGGGHNSGVGKYLGAFVLVYFIDFSHPIVNNFPQIAKINADKKTINQRKSALSAGNNCFSASCFAQTPTFDSLSRLLNKTQKSRSDTARINTLNALAYELQSTNPDTALILYNQALEIAQGIASPTIRLKETATAYYNIGIICKNKGNYEKALDYYLKALSIKEEIGDKKGMAESYINIGIIHTDKGNYEKALDSYLKALSIKKEIGDKNGMAVSFHNIGVIHHNKGDFEKALEFYLKSLSIKEEIGDKNGMANSYNNIGLLNTNLKKFAEARKYLKKSLQLSKEIGTKEWTRNAYSGLSQLDSTLGNWKSAYQYHKLYSVYNDSILNEETTKQIADMQTRYETDKKEKENQLLRKEEQLIELQKKRAVEEARINAEKISKRNQLQYTFIAIVLFILGMSLGVFKRFKVPAKVMVVAVFVVFMLFFEFTLVLTDPVIDYVTGGAPLLKLMFNSVIAGVLFFLHRKSEKWVLRKGGENRN